MGARARTATLFLSLLTVVLPAASWTPVRAACAVARGFGSLGPYGQHTYVETPGCTPYCVGWTSVTSEFRGYFWGLGVGDPAHDAGIDNGSFPAFEPGSFPYGTNWIDSYPYLSATILGQWSQSLEIDGCIDGAGSTNGLDGNECLVVLLADQAGGEGYFAVTSDRVDGNGTADFLQPGSAPIRLVEVPRPGITSSTNLGQGRIQLTVQPPVVPPEALYLDVPGCGNDIVVGYRLYLEVQPPGSPPSDRSRIDRQVAEGGEAPDGGPLPLGTPASVIIEPACAGWGIHLTTSWVFDSGFETPYVSADSSVVVSNCTDFDCDGFCNFSPAPEIPFDCDDHDPDVHPFAVEVCNDKDDDCNDLVDEDAQGEDADGDLVRGLCDNCPLTSNPLQDDSDADGLGDACDNCALAYNPSQSDRDLDTEGDLCDLDDGLVYLLIAADPVFLEWQDETAFDGWNVYRGDLETLVLTGEYTQATGSHPLAAQFCGLASSAFPDSDPVPDGQAAFYLVSGTAGGVESGLGEDGAGQPRPATNVCP